MICVRKIVACLAVGATACLSANAHGVASDAIRAVEATADVLAGVRESNGAIADVADLESGISNTDDWPDFAELPLVGNIKTNDGSRSIIVSSYNPKDHRDWNSFYAATHERSETTFLFDVQDDGLLLQLVSNTAQAVPLGSFLAVHRARGDDEIYEGYLRVIAHAVTEKAAIWQFVKHGGRRFLQIKANRDATGAHTVGWYVAVPPNSVRDHKSNWIAVTPDLDLAVPVQVEAYQAP